MTSISRTSLLFVGVVALGCACRRSPALPLFWITDDGERVGRWDAERPFMRGQDNPVWSPGRPVRLFGLPGETLALQVGARAGAAGIRDMAVSLDGLRARVTRYVVHDLSITRRSGGKDRGESLGWAPGAMPEGPPVPGLVPDVLIPVEFAPPWADYPMTAAPGEQRVVWIDIELPADLPAGRYPGRLTATAAAGLPAAVVPVEVEVGPMPLPYAAARTMVYHEAREVIGRTGSPAAETQFLQLMHRHHLSAVSTVNSAADVQAQRDALTGALYTPARGYDGPGPGLGADVVPLGTYGSLGPPTPERLRQVEAAVQALDALGVLSRQPRPDVFLYAADEACADPAGPAWRRALSQSAIAAVRALPVGHTCSQDPAGQPVDLAIVFAGEYDPAKAAAARRLGKQVWIYNGLRPATGSFLTDGGFLSLRVNGWLQAQAGIPRWFYWESTFWNDDNRGGQGPYDPLVRAETFHNPHGDHANGDGVLVYPGTQLQAGWRSVGLAGVLPSMRLKQWRRGIADAGYLALARARDPAAAEGVAGALLGPAFARRRGPPSWPQAGAAYFLARRRLYDIIAAPRPAR